MAVEVFEREPFSGRKMQREASLTAEMRRSRSLESLGNYSHFSSLRQKKEKT